MAHLKHRTNEYSDMLGQLFDDCPKSVLAAIAVSFATCGGSNPEDAITGVVREWHILHQAGIVPQQPPAKYPRPSDEF